ncbi:Glycosyltransferase [Abeliophyllum distichum]|uniref:Glycosyltransferase n=1 Tax=Abeliophyllum distichum TaxID=126358 RepID=A0ABD1Q4N1_9LAMI
MPLKLDHSLNVRLVVEDGVNVEVTKDDDREFKRDKVAKAINKVVVEKSIGEAIKSKDLELSKKMSNCYNILYLWFNSRLTDVFCNSHLVKIALDDLVGVKKAGAFCTS